MYSESNGGGLFRYFFKAQKKQKIITSDHKVFQFKNNLYLFGKKIF